MWRIYLTNAWLMVLTCLSLPYLIIRFRHRSNTSDLMYFFSLVAEKISGISVQISGRENLTSGPVVYVFNHQSSMDGIPLGRLHLKNIAIIGKRELAFVPFIGWAFWLAGNVLLDRGDARRAQGQLDAGVRAMRDRGQSIAIFPEGARNHESEGFLPFKRGGFAMAIAAHVPVQPIVIESYKKVYDKHARRVSGGPVRVHILPAIPTIAMGAKDSHELTHRVREIMTATYGTMEKD